MTCGFVRVFSQVRGDDLPGGLHADGPFACVAGAEGIDRWLAKCSKVYRKLYDVVTYAYRSCRFEKVFTYPTHRRYAFLHYLSQAGTSK